jgi:ubiquinone/menaquinone biosynthesis C-methylase UbiE
VASYYDHNLSAERLKKVYEIAPARVRRYLDAEVSHVLERVHRGDVLLELGCGYGRILPRLAQRAAVVIGIDTSVESLLLGQEMVSNISNCILAKMDAARLAFCDGIFDIVVCIQNGISAFHVDQNDLIRESIRVTRPGGRAVFSTYSDEFWEDRLEWFRLQSESGLVGAIDYEKTHDGVIVCKDGFSATTVRPNELLALTADLDVDAEVVGVDKSSLFFEVIRR